MEGVSLAATPEALSIHEIRSTRWIPEGGNGVSGEHVARLTTTPLYRIVTNDDNIPEKAPCRTTRSVPSRGSQSVGEESSH